MDTLFAIIFIGDKAHRKKQDEGLLIVNQAAFEEQRSIRYKLWQTQRGWYRGYYIFVICKFVPDRFSVGDFCFSLIFQILICRTVGVAFFESFCVAFSKATANPTRVALVASAEAKLSFWRVLFAMRGRRLRLRLSVARQFSFAPTASKKKADKSDRSHVVL